MSAWKLLRLSREEEIVTLEAQTAIYEYVKNLQIIAQIF